MSNGAEQVDLAVRLQVWSFGWQKLSVHTAFNVNLHSRSATTRSPPTPCSNSTASPRYMPKASPHVQANGDIGAAAYANELRPYLDADGLDMSIARLPWLSWCPDYSWKFKPGNATLLNYLTNVLSRLQGQRLAGPGRRLPGG